MSKNIRRYTFELDSKERKDEYEGQRKKRKERMKGRKDGLDMISCPRP